MGNLSQYVVLVLAPLLTFSSIARATTMTFDQSQWMTGDVNEQYPADSSGDVTNSHVDYFYYFERLPMCMTVIDDSLGQGSSSRTYDSALLGLVVAGEGLSGNDSMRVFGRRITRRWSESGVSWTYCHASPDSAWGTAGGDLDSLPCMDSIIVDTAVDVYDTLYFHLDTGFVRHMIEHENIGWIMMAENIVDRAIFQFYTEDIATPDYRPTLTVYYTDGAPDAGWRGRRRRMIQTGEKTQ